MGIERGFALLFDPLMHFEWKKSRMFPGFVRCLGTADVLVKLLCPGSCSRGLPSNSLAPQSCKRRNMCVRGKGHAAKELQSPDSKVAVDRVCSSHAADFRIVVVEKKGRPFEESS